MEKVKERFIREIQPLLHAFSAREIVKVCNCSHRYAAFMKKRKKVSHPAFF